MNQEYCFVSTDSGIRGLHDECGMKFPVEKISHLDALNKYKPDIVISSWMELGQDWTSSFRACSSVQEYILIGEADSGVCGRLWETWGVGSRSRGKRRRPPFEQDGFTRHNLFVPQIGRTDDPWNRRSRSSTVIFRRQRSEEDQVPEPAVIRSSAGVREKDTDQGGGPARAPPGISCVSGANLCRNDSDK